MEVWSIPELYLPILVRLNVREFKSLRRVCSATRHLPFAAYRQERYKLVDPERKMNPVNRRYQYQLMREKQIAEMDGGTLIEILDLIEESGQPLATYGTSDRGNHFWQFIRKCVEKKVYEVVWIQDKVGYSFHLMGHEVRIKRDSRMIGKPGRLLDEFEWLNKNPDSKLMEILW
jgi:hypothetical protein